MYMPTFCPLPWIPPCPHHIRAVRHSGPHRAHRAATAHAAVRDIQGMKEEPWPTVSSTANGGPAGAAHCCPRLVHHSSPTLSAISVGRRRGRADDRPSPGRCPHRLCSLPTSGQPRGLRRPDRACAQLYGKRGSHNWPGLPAEAVQGGRTLAPPTGRLPPPAGATNAGQTLPAFVRTADSPHPLPPLSSLSRTGATAIPARHRTPHERSADEPHSQSARETDCYGLRCMNIGIAEDREVENPQGRPRGATRCQ
jgi:hypothetical protein